MHALASTFSACTVSMVALALSLLVLNSSICSSSSKHLLCSSSLPVETLFISELISSILSFNSSTHFSFTSNINLTSSSSFWRLLLSCSNDSDVDCNFDASSSLDVVKFWIDFSADCFCALISSISVFIWSCSAIKRSFSSSRRQMHALASTFSACTVSMVAIKVLLLNVNSSITFFKSSWVFFLSKRIISFSFVTLLNMSWILLFCTLRSWLFCCNSEFNVLNFWFCAVNSFMSKLNCFISILASLIRFSFVSIVDFISSISLLTSLFFCSSCSLSWLSFFMEDSWESIISSFVAKSVLTISIFFNTSLHSIRSKFNVLFEFSFSSLTCFSWCDFSLSSSFSIRMFWVASFNSKLVFSLILLPSIIASSFSVSVLMSFCIFFSFSSIRTFIAILSWIRV